jgi:alkylated DNA repair dioxygenase AlkB
MNSSWRIIALDSDKGIAGVLRLSDNRKFFLGDRTVNGPITKFQINHGKVLVYLGGSSIHGIKEIAHYTIFYLDNLS